MILHKISEMSGTIMKIMNRPSVIMILGLIQQKRGQYL